jgi:AmiR/NasT family two-component response regulator
VLFDARELAENLRLALVSRRSIDRAIGIVMAKAGLDQDQAFDLLVKASQQANVKLRDLATDMVHKAGQASRGDRD